jgi:16S rRNA (cytosine967-C5)-methyltransferase
LTPEIAFNVDKGDIFKTELFKNGKISIQDQGAIKACLLLNPKKREKILDMCSAPGGKTALIGNLTKNECNLFAVDVNKKRLELVEEICKRMGVSAKTIHADATIIKPEDYGFFDKILLDAPCTGLGTIRTKPEVRWYRNEEDIQKVIPLQKKLFYNGLKLLDKNGILVYVTCSNEQEETIGIVKSFEQIEVIDVMQLYPFKFNTEGFFIAVIKRRG